MFKCVHNFFKKKNKELDKETIENLLPKRTATVLKLPYDRIIQCYDPKLPTVVIIDDSNFVLAMVLEHLTKIGITTDKYNILKFYGIYAPFVLVDTLTKIKEEYGLIIEFAVIDILLPGKLKTDDGYKKMDGVDVSIILNNEYGCKKIIFLSGNGLNMGVEYIDELNYKFNTQFNKELREYIITKTTDDKLVIERLYDVFTHSDNL